MRTQPWPERTQENFDREAERKAMRHALFNSPNEREAREDIQAGRSSIRAELRRMRLEKRKRLRE